MSTQGNFSASALATSTLFSGTNNSFTVFTAVDGTTSCYIKIVVPYKYQNTGWYRYFYEKI